MHVTLLLTRLDIVKNSYCYEGGAPIMQALQISDLNINPLITLPRSPLQKKKKKFRETEGRIEITRIWIEGKRGS